MIKNLVLLTVLCLIISCFSFWSKGETSYSGLFQSIDQTLGSSGQDGEIDKNKAYLDSLVWEQMMLQAELISPQVAKMNYSKGKDKNTSQGNGQKAGSNQTNSTESFSVSSMSVLPNQAEYDALMDFYQAMGGPNWFNKSGWSSANPNVVQSVSNFHGVTLDANGHVIFLVLYQNNLNGTIPESFGDLTYLEHIQLVKNPFIGQLPQSIGNLNKVKELLLYSNNMTGTIPTTIGNMTALENIHLYVNELTGSIPSTITSLPNLKFFSVYDNNLTGVVPSNLGSLNQMTHFYINGNAITGGIPTSIGNMTVMKEIYLYSNQLSGAIPTSIGNLSYLTHLFVNGNQLSGTLPTSLGNLSNLQFFWAQDNNVTGQIPWEIGGLQALDQFFVYRNNLTGTLPSSFGNMPALRQLKLEENQIGGTIPPSYGNLVNINALTLNDNKLTGSIPSTFCSFVNISHLGLHNNYLEGTIPNCLYDKNMWQFTVRYNHYNFEELTYAKSKVGDYYLYAPQYLKFVDTVYVQPNTSMNLTVDDGNYQGSPSIYRWKKNGVWMHDASANNKVISINCNSPACEGMYFLEITNPDFVGPHLTGNLYYVKIGTDLTQTICLVEEESYSPYN
ncbi:hypothetical protein ACPUEN_00940 [Algoriphagus yeomjeoni]|uniref:hypothetical protein n=1 Tax=Algoriphagus yeomjeoni TaxID=291403 RepID=UPI003CE473B5